MIGMETGPEAIARQYRREAKHLRHAVEIIQDEALREQLLLFAQQYEALAAGIEPESAAQAGAG